MAPIPLGIPPPPYSTPPPSAVTPLAPVLATMWVVAPQAQANVVNNPTPTIKCAGDLQYPLRLPW